MVLEFDNIHVRYGKEEILHGVSLQAEEKKITGIIGPNGCGKSTLVKTVFGIAPMTEGKILLEGKDTATLTGREISARLGYVGQETECVFDFTVEDVIGMALYNQKNRKGSSSQIIQEAMDELNISGFSGRSILTLSGGERKMVFLARAVAQGVDTIILDEPTNHLDVSHQLFLLNYLKRTGKTILLVIHDLRLAAHFCDCVYLMRAGEMICHGTPEEVLTKSRVKEVFHVGGEVVQNQRNGLDFELDFEERSGGEPGGENT